MFMKKLSLNLVLSLGILSLVFFGWGCNKRTAEKNVPNQPVNGVQQEMVAVNDSSSDDPSSGMDDLLTDMEPQALAYLQMTQGAQIIVSRGTQQTDGLPDMALFAGDQLEVKSGEAWLLYPETGMSVLETGTKVTLIPDGNPGEEGLGVRLLMEAGKIWTRLERLLGVNEDFSVEANNVVATVRGTAFGMQFVNGDLDIVVADHQIKVSGKALLNTGKTVSDYIILAAGNGVRVNPDEISKMTDQRALLLKKMRVLTDVEKKQPGYVFGLRKLNPEALKKPVKPIIWSAPLFLKPEFRDRLTPDVLRRWEAYVDWYRRHQAELLEAERLRMADSALQIKFQPPLRDITLLEMTAPTSAPVINGPEYK